MEKPLKTWIGTEIGVDNIASSANTNDTTAQPGVDNTQQVVGLELRKAGQKHVKMDTIAASLHNSFRVLADLHEDLNTYLGGEIN